MKRTLNEKEIAQAKMEYAALIGYYLCSFNENIDYIMVLTKIREIAEEHEIKLDEEGLIDSELFFEDAIDDTHKVLEWAKKERWYK